MKWLPRENGAIDERAVVDLYFLVPLTVGGALAGCYLIWFWSVYEIGLATGP